MLSKIIAKLLILISFFKKYSIEILEYLYDYCINKTITEIATIIENDVPRVIAYLERMKHTFQGGEISGLSKYGEVTVGARIEKFSS
jgi:hypothetical protein